MRRRLQLALAVVACVGLTASVAFAQGTTKSALSGVVFDSGGGAVPGATVIVKHLATGVTTTAVTNSTGAFSTIDPRP